MTWFHVAQMYVYLNHIVTHISIVPCGRNWTFVFASIHEQQFLLPQYCTYDDIELWFSIFPKSVSTLVLYSCLSLIVIRLVQSSIVELCTLFSDRLCSQCAISFVSWWWILLGEMCFTHRNWFTFINFSCYQVSIAIAMAYQLFSSTALDWLPACLTNWPTDQLTLAPSISS